MRTELFIWILWPSFIVAGIAEGIFFTIFDPVDLYVFGGLRKASSLRFSIRSICMCSAARSIGAVLPFIRPVSSHSGPYAPRPVP